MRLRARRNGASRRNPPLRSRAAFPLPFSPGIAPAFRHRPPRVPLPGAGISPRHRRGQEGTLPRHGAGAAPRVPFLPFPTNKAGRALRQDIPLLPAAAGKTGMKLHRCRQERKTAGTAEGAAQRKPSAGTSLRHGRLFPVRKGVAPPAPASSPFLVFRRSPENSRPRQAGAAAHACTDAGQAAEHGGLHSQRGPAPGSCPAFPRLHPQDKDSAPEASRGPALAPCPPA